jgi:hypothetical protein
MKTGMVIVYDEEWAAFYNNGVKEVEGDSYIVEEHVFALLGVEVRSSESLINPDKRIAWDSLDEVTEAEKRDELEREELKRLHDEVEKAEKRYRDRKGN